MTSSKPYLLRAIYEWLVDNEMTPYIMVDAMMPRVQVPERYIEEGKIILNVSPQAVQRLSMTNESVRFNARFSGIVHHISVPTAAVKAVYAFENGRGMVFEEEEEVSALNGMSDQDDDDGGNNGGGSTPPSKGKPSLKIVK